PVMAAPFLRRQVEVVGVGDLVQEDLVARDVCDLGDVAPGGVDVEAVQADAQRRVVDAPDYLPCLLPRADVPTPRERFVRDAHAPGGRLDCGGVHLCDGEA